MTKTLILVAVSTAAMFAQRHGPSFPPSPWCPPYCDDAAVRSNMRVSVTVENGRIKIHNSSLSPVLAVHYIGDKETHLIYKDDPIQPGQTVSIGGLRDVVDTAYMVESALFEDGSTDVTQPDAGWNIRGFWKNWQNAKLGLPIHASYRSAHVTGLSRVFAENFSHQFKREHLQASAPDIVMDADTEADSTVDPFAYNWHYPPELILFSTWTTLWYEPVGIPERTGTSCQYTIDNPGSQSCVGQGNCSPYPNKQQPNMRVALAGESADSQCICGTNTVRAWLTSELIQICPPGVNCPLWPDPMAAATGDIEFPDWINFNMHGWINSSCNMGVTGEGYGLKPCPPSCTPAGGGFSVPKKG